MRKVLAILFLCIFVFQVLPVKAIGKMLCSNQMTEEVHEHCCAKKMNNDHDRFWYLHYMMAAAVAHRPPACYKHALRDEALIKSHHLDVPVQPPNED